MPSYDFDLFTIGAGSGGVASSRRAASYGARVAICENSRIGGTCVIRGCIPKKLLVTAAHYRDDFEDAEGFGWSSSGASFDWGRLIAAKNKEIDRLNGVYIRLLKDSGVEIIEGKGRIIDPHTVAVGERRFSTQRILIATGAWPSLPDLPGIEHAVTSNEALEMDRLPPRIAVVGGGYIAVEFAGLFHGLGAEVTEILRADTVLRGFDHDVRRALAEEMTRRGITLKTGTVVERIEKAGQAFRLITTTGVVEADLVMYATGRVPNTGGLGLEEVDVEIDEIGAVRTDAWSRTTVPDIYAIGDCTNRLNLTPVAIHEGRALAETLFNHNPVQMDYTNVPSAVFSHPPVAVVGLTEAEARDRFAAIDCYISRFKPLKHTLSGREERTMMKLIVDRATDKVLGCHMVGADAPEIIQGFAVALKCGATKAQFDQTVGIHPTAAEEFVTMRTVVA